MTNDLKTGGQTPTPRTDAAARVFKYRDNTYGALYDTLIPSSDIAETLVYVDERVCADLERELELAKAILETANKKFAWLELEYEAALERISELSSER